MAKPTHEGLQYHHYVFFIRDVTNPKTGVVVRSSVSRKYVHRREIGEQLMRFFCRRLGDQWCGFCKVWRAP